MIEKLRRLYWILTHLQIYSDVVQAEAQKWKHLQLVYPRDYPKAFILHQKYKLDVDVLIQWAQDGMIQFLYPHFEELIDIQMKSIVTFDQLYFCAKMLRDYNTPGTEVVTKLRALADLTLRGYTLPGPDNQIYPRQRK